VTGKKVKHTIFIEHVAPDTGIAPDEPEEWFWVGTQRPIEAYSFYYQPVDSMDRHPLCSEGDGDPNKIQALVFGGDLYNPNTKTIKVGPETDGWINIACRDSAIYKMHKIGHTAAAVARAVVEETTVDQRRAMLNAWTSNVCGTGEAFTKQGERIKLRDSLELLPEDSPYLDPLDPEETASIEAIWGPGGAVCLDIHRLQGSPDEVEIPCKDSLSRCTDLLGDWTAHGHVLTGNPKPALVR
jgi:hypothetical protein